MKITVITAFPDFFRAFLDTSIVGRAVKNKLLQVSVIDLRNYGEGDYRKIDDYAFGGGGMVLMAEPLAKALDDLGEGLYVVYPSPQGVTMTQEIVESLSTREHLVMICGHYEGVDERLIHSRVDLELSIGDYVLTGGELPAMVVIDAVSRLIPGVVGKERSVVEDSFYHGMLDTPHFTRPARWRDQDVPPVLLSGDDGSIEQWRRHRSVERTLSRRPDLLSRASLMRYLDTGAYVLWYPRENPRGCELAVVVDACRAYGVDRLLMPVSDRDDRERLRALVRPNGMDDVVKLFPSIHRATQWITSREGQRPFVVGLEDQDESRWISWLEAKRQVLHLRRPPVFAFGDGGEYACDVTMCPVSGDDRDRSALPIQNAVSVVLDRFFGWR
ncbi:MAG: tRNA (guanosine(37)-N1)-methyltransferase TrmD [Dethiosulfovibrio peptidovorans]|nr:MAG: tRNA (guanosine(37)-N1)-methyltransferase TrmD [Dethiosulfovibrio peptidovorans]